MSLQSVNIVRQSPRFSPPPSTPGRGAGGEGAKHACNVAEILEA